MILTIAALMLFSQNAPAPGQNKGRGLLVGPAAERYEELLKKESQLDVARAQLRAIMAQTDYLRLLASSEPIDNAKRITAERAVVEAAEALREASGKYLSKHGHAPACQVDLTQEARCPEAPKE